MNINNVDSVENNNCSQFDVTSNNNNQFTCWVCQDLLVSESEN